MTIWVRVLAACAGVLMIVGGLLGLEGNRWASLLGAVAALLGSVALVIFLRAQKRSG
jgi:sulfite exporter TauE/SafE